MRSCQRRQVHARRETFERFDELGRASLEGVVEDRRCDDRLGAGDDDLERDRVVRHDAVLHELHRLARELDGLGTRLESEDELLGALDDARIGHAEGDVDDDREGTARAEHRREQLVLRRQHADLAVGGHHGHPHRTLPEQAEPSREVAAQPAVERVSGHADAGAGADRQRAAVGLHRFDEFSKDDARSHRDQGPAIAHGDLDLDRLEGAQVEDHRVAIRHERRSRRFVPAADARDRGGRRKRLHDGGDLLGGGRMLDPLGEGGDPAGRSIRLGEHLVRAHAPRSLCEPGVVRSHRGLRRRGRLRRGWSGNRTSDDESGSARRRGLEGGSPRDPSLRVLQHAEAPHVGRRPGKRTRVLRRRSPNLPNKPPSDGR